MQKNQKLNNFSKLTKREKLSKVAELFDNPQLIEKEFESYWHTNPDKQKRFDEFSENTLTNFYLPFGVVPNVKINGKTYTVPAVIEESSVIAAAAKSAKFWDSRGGFHAKNISTEKIGQVHFVWYGDNSRLLKHFSELKKLLFSHTQHITHNMQKRGGGITAIELVDKTAEEPNYYQIKAKFNTCDSMGANFINSCLEEFAQILKDWLEDSGHFSGKEKEVQIIMCILSNYTPDSLVKVWVECPIKDLGDFEDGMTAQEFAHKFEMAVKVAQLDVHRATTHNKGIFNGIDAVILASGNDFRAVEACGHTYAARSGQYKSLTEVSLKNDTFIFSLEIPMSLGVVGGLTTLHPLVKRAIELLDNPSAEKLMQISATIGLANNFGAVKSLVTTGIQKGHMKMHLLNIMNGLGATEPEKKQAVEYFKNNKVSYSAARNFLLGLRENIIPKKNFKTEKTTKNQSSFIH